MRVYKTEEFMKKSKWLHISKSNKASNTKEFVAHTHEFIEIVYVLSGEMTHVIDGQSYDAKHGDVLFMNYGCRHSFSAQSEYSYVNVLFSPERMSEEIVTPANIFSVLCLTSFNEMTCDSDFGRVRFEGAERQEIENILLTMLREYQERQTSWETVLGNYFNTFIIKMLRKYEMEMLTFDVNDVWSSLSAYIESNLNSKIKLTDLAQRCFYNPSYFSRAFKERFGVSLVEYVARKRLDRAVDLLQNTDLSLDEIAWQAGFPDSKSLYHAFSRYLNATPSQYQKVKIREEKK